METLRRKNEGWTTYQARKIARISIRRVNQVWRGYLLTREIPDIGRRVGRPPRPILEPERTLISLAYSRYRVSADMLERLIERDYEVHLPHNHIHKILVELGIAKPLGKKVIRKKEWIRYERRHSLTAVHIDWHQRPNDGIWVFAVEDDASRKLLALVEGRPPTTANSIYGMELALLQGRIRQCIMDHGAQFLSNTGGKSVFQAFLAKHSIKPILCRIKHPQSNGKVEKWFDTYERHRDAFSTVEEFITWYNDVRPHRSLNVEMLETPEMAFQRKMRAEA